jgi:cytochrome b subunit of formate dehydrogenase
MSFFEYARDYYGDWLPIRPLVGTGITLFLGVVCFLGIHYARRAAGQPEPTDGSEDVQLAAGTFFKYECAARLFHWGIAIILLALAVSGGALFAPGAVKPFRVSWLRMHEVAAALFIIGVTVHAVVAPRNGRWRSMWADGQDWRDFRTTSANFVGRTRRYPRFGKYSHLQKLFHVMLALLSVGITFTGGFLLLSAETWATFSHQWLRWQRLVHDLGAFVLFAIVVGHVYVGVLRARRPDLMALLTGVVPASHFNRRHSTARWRPILAAPRRALRDA